MPMTSPCGRRSACRCNASCARSNSSGAIRTGVSSARAPRDRSPTEATAAAVPRKLRREYCVTSDPPPASGSSLYGARQGQVQSAPRVLECVGRDRIGPVLEEDLSSEIKRRRTFAIISHPDAGKTTLTEKLLLFGGAIQMAGTVKGRKAARHATSDWMRLEQQRGISVTSSVMQFPYGGCVVNLLDTPGHEDFSEDTYRTLTAVDSALMVIDCAKGVEERTIKLMEVCRLRDTPIMTFINKLDRDGRPPIELMDEVESVLRIGTAPVTWPVGMGRELRGIYHLAEDRIYVYSAGERGRVGENRTIDGLASAAAREFLGDLRETFAAEIELVRGATHAFDPAAYRAGRQTPVFFGSAINNFGVEELLAAFVAEAPGPLPRVARQRVVEPLEPALTGFVFKIQANMDPGHRDRIAFLRLCSGRYARGMRLYHARLGKEVRVSDALTFMAAERAQA